LTLNELIASLAIVFRCIARIAAIIALLRDWFALDRSSVGGVDNDDHRLLEARAPARGGYSDF
jgi:hypothetical protein